MAPGPQRQRAPAGRRCWAWLAGAASILSALACSGTTPPSSPPTPVILTVGMPEGGQAVASRLRTVLKAYEFERLTTYGPTGRPAPRLLERWSTSADGLVWRLTMRTGVVFRDGTPLTNADLKDAITQAMANPVFRDLAVCLPDVTDVSTEGLRDVVVRLSRRCYYLLDELSDISVVRTVPGKPPIGTGPFALVSGSAAEITLEANPLYDMGKPQIARIVTKPYDTLRTAWAEMMRGRLDFVWDVGTGAAEFLRDQSGIETRAYPSFYCPSIIFNHRHKNRLSQPVRRALNLAIDRAELLRQGLNGEGLPADGPVWPYYWAFDRKTPSVPFDRSRARALLDEQRVEHLTFTCLVPEGFAFFERLSLLAQRQLRAVGVDMKLESAPVGRVFERVGRGDYDAVLVNPIGGPLSNGFYRMWHSPDPAPRWNTWGYRSDEVDAALDAMRDAADDARYVEAVARFVAAVRGDPPALFLVWPNAIQAVNRRFELPESAAGRDAMTVIASWRVRPESPQ